MICFGHHHTSLRFFAPSIVNNKRTTINHSICLIMKLVVGCPWCCGRWSCNEVCYALLTLYQVFLFPNTTPLSSSIFPLNARQDSVSPHNQSLNFRNTFNATLNSLCNYFTLLQYYIKLHFDKFGLMRSFTFMVASIFAVWLTLVILKVYESV